MINLKNLTLSFILISLFSATHAIAMDIRADEPGKTVRVRPTYEELRAIGESFVTFLQKVGQSDMSVTPEDVSPLHASQCKKVVNGTVLFTESKDMPDQLNSARKAAGKWTIKTLLTSASSEDGTCTLQFKWKGENMGKHTTMVILYLDEMGKISQIHEVYNEYKKKMLGSSECD